MPIMLSFNFLFPTSVWLDVQSTFYWALRSPSLGKWGPTPSLLSLCAVTCHDKISPLGTMMKFLGTMATRHPELDSPCVTVYTVTEKSVIFLPAVPINVCLHFKVSFKKAGKWPCTTSPWPETTYRSCELLIARHQIRKNLFHLKITPLLFYICWGRA